MFNAFKGVNFIRQSAYPLRLTPDDDNLQTVMVVEMNMLRRDDMFMKIMLQVRQFIQQFPLVVVIDRGDGSDYLFAFDLRGPFPLYQFFTYQVANGLGTVCIMAFRYKLIEGGNQIGRDGYSKPDDIAHIWIPVSDI